MKYYKVSKRDGIEKVVEAEDNLSIVYSDYSSISPAYDTIEELYYGQGVLKLPCKECGGLISTNTRIKEQLVSKTICSSCNHWDELSKTMGDPKRVVVKGTCYYAYDRADKNTAFLGFGGAEWKIQFHDGRYLETNNMWCQGDIADHYKDRMPDNAEFVREQLIEEMV